MKIYILVHYPWKIIILTCTPTNVSSIIRRSSSASLSPPFSLSPLQNLYFFSEGGTPSSVLHPSPPPHPSPLTQRAHAETPPTTQRVCARTHAPQCMHPHPPGCAHATPPLPGFGFRFPETAVRSGSQKSFLRIVVIVVVVVVVVIVIVISRQKRRQRRRRRSSR